MREPTEQTESWRPAAAVAGLLAATVALAAASELLADGMAVPPKLYKGVPYQGSIEERSQEAIVIFHGSQQPGPSPIRNGAVEDVILKISVQGEVDNFAWIVPFPNEPKVAKEDQKLFTEIHAYVEKRLEQLSAKYKSGKSLGAGAEPATAEPRIAPVEVLSRKIVGAFDVAVLRENQPGALNGWLEAEGYQTLSDADDVLDFYRQKKYVYACVKVSEARLSGKTPVEIHPLRFSFKTGGRDGIYFPMKMTGLQRQPFDVNLYVFYKAWINDHLSKFGYEHRGFRRKYRDWDSPRCKPNAGKSYSAPQRDPFLKDQAHRLPTVTGLFQKLHPSVHKRSERYYLTNIQARGLKPEAVRQWSDDLWLFPYYVDRGFIPYDARPGGAASASWPEEVSATEGNRPGAPPTAARSSAVRPAVLLGLGIGFGAVVGVALGFGIQRMRRTSGSGA